MNIIIESMFRAYMYIGFGLIMEIFASSVHTITDGEITEEDKKLKGSVSLFMVPVYGILLLLIFEPINSLFPYTTPSVALSVDRVEWIFIKYIIWCVSFTTFEVLCGYLYHRFLKIRPWDYSQQKYSLFSGYTKLTLIPMWGAAGILLEYYSQFLIKLSPYVSSVILK